MVKSSSIRIQIAQQRKFGEESFSLAHRTRRTGSYADYDKAIKNFSLAYKLSLLLNSQDGTRDECCYNLGKAYIARRRDPEDISRGIELLETLLEFPTPREEDRQNDSDSAKGDIYFYLAFGHEKLHHNDKAIKHYTAALLQYDKEQNHKQTCETHLKIANISNAEHNFPEAQRNFKKAAKIYLESGEIGNSLMARICQANAAYHDKTYNSSEIVKMLNTISRDTPHVMSSAFQGKILCEAGLLYSLLLCNDSALFCFHKAIKLCSPNTRRLALAYQNYGIISYNMGYPAEAVEKLQRASQIFGMLRDRSAQGKSFRCLSHAQNDLELREEARESLIHALKAFEDAGERLGQSHCHEELGLMAHNNGNPVKARYHFKAALKCLPEVELLRKERLQKLFLLLQMSDNVDGGLTTPKDPRRQKFGIRRLIADKSNQRMSIHSTGSPIVTNSRINVVNREPLYANDVVDTVPIPSKREYPAARAKRFDRGRRDYADENDRPVQHVARGISNVTDYTNTIAPLRRSTDLSEDFYEGETSDSTKASSSDDSSDSDRKKRALIKRRNRQKQLKKLVQTTTLPLSSVTTPKDRDESPMRGLNDDQSYETTVGMKKYYKKQLGDIPESSDSERFTNVTSSTSSVSSRRARSKRPGAAFANSSLRRSTDLSDDYAAETSDDSTVALSSDDDSVSDGKKVLVKRHSRDIGRDPNDTLPTLPHRKDAPNPAFQSPNTENPYATVRKTPKRQQALPDSTSSSPSEADDYPQSEQTIDSEPSPTPYRDPQAEDELRVDGNSDPDPPPVKDADKKNKKSGACVVM